ncbi:uncharacterized protein [Ptychodera flava]|uniref:uncharacterized protein n=1 Tax=Ptychodera flava TaxID=63121 RepID=UPI00396AB105
MRSTQSLWFIFGRCTLLICTVKATADVSSGTFTIKVPTTTIDCTVGATITFDLDICDIGGSGGEVTAVKLYYTATNDYDDGNGALGETPIEQFTAVNIQQNENIP